MELIKTQLNVQDGQLISMKQMVPVRELSSKYRAKFCAYGPVFDLDLEVFDFFQKLILICQDGLSPRYWQTDTSENGA